MREDSTWNAHLAEAACDWMREKCPRSYSLRIHWKLSNEAGRSWNWSGLWPNFLLHETSASRLSLMYSTWLCLRDCITWPPCCLLIERHFQPVQGNAMLLLPKLITQCAPKIETIAVHRSPKNHKTLHIQYTFPSVCLILSLGVEGVNLLLEKNPIQHPHQGTLPFSSDRHLSAVLCLWF